MSKSRYIPFTQQPYLCVAACFQMVMYRRGIKLLSQEEFGYALGLIVPEEDKWLFSLARTGKKPKSGWGTQIQLPEFNPNLVFKRLGIPLTYKLVTTNDIANPEALGFLLKEIAATDQDALLCFDYGKLWEINGYQGGHVCVFDHLSGDNITLIDPERNVPKSRTRTLDQLYKAMDFHGPDSTGGVWLIDKP